jgi:hypothetical protein
VITVLLARKKGLYKRDKQLPFFLQDSTCNNLINENDELLYGRILI